MIEVLDVVTRAPQNEYQELIATALAAINAEVENLKIEIAALKALTPQG